MANELVPSMPVLDTHFVLDGNALDHICIRVADGGTLIDLCREWNISFGFVSNWLHSCPKRSERYRQALNDRGEWATERMLQELRRLAFLDIRQAFNADGTLKPINEWSPELGAAIQAIEINELYEDSGNERVWTGFAKKIKLWDKNKSLETLCKTMQLFSERVEISASESFAELIKQSLKAKNE